MTPEQAAAKIAELKKQYGSRLSNTIMRRGSICVGGTLDQCIPDDPVFSHSRFPGFHRLTTVLTTLNSDLLTAEAAKFARRIIGFNDKEEFDMAWREAERALCWPAQPLTV